MSAEDAPAGAQAGYAPMGDRPLPDALKRVTTRKTNRDITQKDVDAAHHTAFGNLHDVIENAYAVKGDELPYWDPFGWMDSGVGRQPIDLRKNMMAFWRPVFDGINDMIRRDRRTNLGYAAEKVIEKELQRSSFSLPIFFTPDVYRTSTEDTPIADSVARVAIQEDQVKLDEETDIGTAGSFTETGTWPENDDTYRSDTFDVVSYGRQNKVSDFVQLAAQGLRSTRALTEEAQVASVRQYEERQVLVGKATNLDTTGTVAANDASGFDGLPDIVPAANVKDATGAAMTISRVRENIKELRRQARASRETIAHFTDHTTFEDLKSDLTEFTRYDSPDDTLEFGFDAIVIDNTPVFETHALPDADADRIFASGDMASLQMGMLQDVTMHPLARDAPQEEFATDAYGTAVARTNELAVYFENLA